MGLFTNSKLTALDENINLLAQRMIEFAEFESKTIHPSISNMFSQLFDQVFKLYYPNQQSFQSQAIKVTTKQQGKMVSNYMPVSYWIAAVFNMGLALERDYKVTIFKDAAQRSFAHSLSPDWL